MNICKADKRDIQAILALQYVAYQTEAEMLGNYDIPPLKQTMAEVEREYERGMFLKAVDETGAIIGSVRVYRENGTAYIGKLIVHPSCRKRGIGSALMREIEHACPAERYELFTSDQSLGNLRLYENLGYTRFQQRQVTPVLRLVYLEKVPRPVVNGER